MDNTEKIPQAQIPSRRKFVWSVGLLSLFAAISATVKYPFLSKKKAVSGKAAKGRTITMLTQDGRLVQIDEALITANSKKVTDHELQTWIKK